MKKYERPSLEVVQLAVRENIAANPITKETADDGTVVTNYNLQSYFNPQVS
jgi:hypothetical protein